MRVFDFSSKPPAQNCGDDADPQAVVAPAGETDTAISDAWERVYNELRALARAYMAREPRRVTLQATALVHEAFVKLKNQSHLEWKDHAHFFRIAASAMRQILVDHARRRATDRRGGDRLRVSLSSSTPAARSEEIDVLALEEALADLAAHDERKARVVELRFFAGLTGKQIGDVLGISPKTVESDWYFSRAWLRRHLESVADNDD